MIKRLDHIGIAVKHLESATALYSKLLGRSPGHRERVEDQEVELVVFNVGGQEIELLQGTSNDSPISKFIEKRGEGIHHLSLEVQDIEQALATVKADGFVLIDDQPRRGAQGTKIAFIHPKSTGGVLIELVEREQG